MSIKKQFSTFYIDERLYGIDVMKVQEVTKDMSMTKVPLSPNYVHGLINLRGQIATAIGLRNLFKIEEKEEEDYMNVVCNVGGVLMSFLVDRIGDVMEVDESVFEESPDIVPHSIKKYMDGVYKIDGDILSVLNIDNITTSLNKNIA